MNLIKNAKYDRDFKIIVTFDNGETFQIDFKDVLNGPIFEPLKNIEEFKRFRLNTNIDTIVWPNGADFAPEFLYQLGQKQKKKS